MHSDNDSSASGYITDSFEGISQEFTDVEVLSTSATNVVARAKRYGRWWLLKALNGQVANEAAYRQRLRKELELLMQLQHRHVVSASGLEQVKGLGCCIVMEYIEGKTLKEWLSAPRSRKERKRIAMELAEAVAYIHSKGIVHRDLKPENIIITANGGNVKLIDFGLADTDSHTILKQPAGTRRYMSPEQMQTSVADVRNDIYSLGIIFGQMNLGYGSIIKRCIAPIDSRYRNVAELQEAVKRHERRKGLMVWGFLSLAVIALAVIVGVQTIRVRTLSQQVSNSQNEQREIQTTVSSLNDSLAQVVASHHSLQQKQQAVEAERQRIETAIADGERVINRALLAAGVKQHLDTLSSLQYLRMDVFNRMNDGGKACNDYLKAIGARFSESEMAEITNALTVYNGNRIKEIINRYTKLKETYDKAIMQGN